MQGDTGVQGDTATVQQVVQSAYHQTDELLPLMDLSYPGEEVGDGLLEFIIRETHLEVDEDDEDDISQDSLEHWEMARRRMDTVLEEVTRVRDALYRYGPQA